MVVPQRVLAQHMRLNRSVHQAITPSLYREITISPDQLHSPLYDGFAAAMRMSGATDTSKTAQSSENKTSAPARPRSSALAKRRRLETPPTRQTPTPSTGAGPSNAYNRVQDYDPSQTRKALALRCVKVLNIKMAVNVDGAYKGLDMRRLSGVETVRLDCSNPDIWAEKLSANPPAFEYLQPLRPITVVLYRFPQNVVPDIVSLAPPSFLERVRRLILVIAQHCNHYGGRNRIDVLLSSIRRCLPLASNPPTQALPAEDKYSSRSPSMDISLADFTARQLPPGLSIELINIASPSDRWMIADHARIIRAVEERSGRFTFVNFACGVFGFRSELGLLEIGGTFLAYREAEGVVVDVAPSSVRTVLSLAEYVKGKGEGMLTKDDVRLYLQ